MTIVPPRATITAIYASITAIYTSTSGVRYNDKQPLVDEFHFTWLVRGGGSCKYGDTESRASTGTGIRYQIYAAGALISKTGRDAVYLDNPSSYECADYAREYVHRVCAGARFRPGQGCASGLLSGRDFPSVVCGSLRPYIKPLVRYTGRAA